MSNRRCAYLTAGCTAAILALAALGAPQDPWTQAQVIRPEQLDKELSKAQKPTLINVAFRVLYQNGHIPGSPYFGAGRDPRQSRTSSSGPSLSLKDMTTAV
jgi:hypothetical protein